MWHIEFDPDTRRLSIRLRDHVTVDHLRELAEAHAAALEATGGLGFRVFLDLRQLFPLESDAVAFLGALKQVAARQSACLGLVVLADSPTVALQQTRIRVRKGTNPDRELITLDPTEAEQQLGS